MRHVHLLHTVCDLRLPVGGDADGPGPAVEDEGLPEERDVGAGGDELERRVVVEERRVRELVQALLEEVVVGLGEAEERSVHGGGHG